MRGFENYFLSNPHARRGPSIHENGFITFVGAAHCSRPVREPAVGLPYKGLCLQIKG